MTAIRNECTIKTETKYAPEATGAQVFGERKTLNQKLWAPFCLIEAWKGGEHMKFMARAKIVLDSRVIEYLIVAIITVLLQKI